MRRGESYLIMVISKALHDSMSIRQGHHVQRLVSAFEVEPQKVIDGLNLI